MVAPQNRWECKIYCSNTAQDSVSLNRERISAPTGSLIKITSKTNAAQYAYVKVTSVSEDPRLKGYGLSVDIMGEFRTNEEVIVEMVDPSDCRIRLVEVSVSDQYVSRGDMWRLRKNFKDTCTYRKKYMVFSGIGVQVMSLYKSDPKNPDHDIDVTSGYIDEETLFTFRTLSSYTQLFFQIGKEMWENDYEGVENWENFEKVVYQFVKTLFERWESTKANHDLQIIFFTRILCERDNYPPEYENMIQFDMYDRPYLDLYDVVCDGGNITDVKPIISIMKRRFNKLGLIITQLSKSYNMEVSNSSEGSFLECINLALDQYNNHYKDRVHYRTGQQIVVVTAGCGVFYVDRELASLTKHRVQDLGVGADVICLGSKPLHATPLFVFNHQTKGNERMYDKFQVPHWMNVHFYALHPLGDKFLPITGLGVADPGSTSTSSSLYPFSGAAEYFPENLEKCSQRQLEELCEAYDDTLFTIAPIYHHHHPGTDETHSEDAPNSLSSDIETQSNSVGTLGLGTSSSRRVTHNHPIPETNPFRPSELPRPVTNSRRRWAHVFPSMGNWHGLSRSLRIEQDSGAETMDWQSLITPACFPCTTDYYPDPRQRDKCRETPYTLIGNTNSRLDLSMIKQEIVMQRLSRGFQVVLKRHQSKSTVTVSQGYLYHEIDLTDPTAGPIQVKISKPEKKGQFPLSKQFYKYCLSPFLGKLNSDLSDLLKCRSERRTRDWMRDERWNSFDNWIISLMDTDSYDTWMERLRPAVDSDSYSTLRPWQSRYILVPRPDVFFKRSQHNVNQPDYSDREIANSFYNILFAMNNLKHLETNVWETGTGRLSLGLNPESAPNSPLPEELSAGGRPRTGTLVAGDRFSFTYEDELGVKSDQEKDNSKRFLKIFSKSKSNELTSQSKSELEEFRDTMTPENGMKFVNRSGKQHVTGQSTVPVLPPKTFLGSWLVEFVLRTKEGLSLREAIEFCEQLLAQRIICELADKSAPVFVDGFYFYYIRGSSKGSSSSSDSPVTSLREPFEVATPDTPGRTEDFDVILECPLEIESEEKESERKEFFSVHFDACYKPQHAFGLTLEWDRATAQLIESSYLVRWRSKADKAKFQLIQVPLKPFDSPEMGQQPERMPPLVAPFRAPITIPIPSVKVSEIEEMLHRFGFLKDFPAGNFTEDRIPARIRHRRYDFAHISGIALVRVVPGGAGETGPLQDPLRGGREEEEEEEVGESSTLLWVSNPFLGSKKWHPKIFLPNSTREEKFCQSSFEDLLSRFMVHREEFLRNKFGDRLSEGRTIDPLAIY